MMNFMCPANRFCIAGIGIAEPFYALVDKDVVHKKISNTIPKKTKELFEHSEHLKYAASNYFITDNSMVRDISNSINFDQNGQQQLQQLISSASSGNDLIDKSLKTHLKRITDLIKFGASGKINKSLLVELNKDLNNKLGEIKNAKIRIYFT